MLNFNSENVQSSITKFEHMLKTNHVYFFDAQEFEDIIVHYLGFGDTQLAKKALRMGLDQHPSNIELMMLQSEIFILDEKFDNAIELLNYIQKIAPLEEEIALQKATIASKTGDHKGSIEFLHTALEFSEDPVEIWNLLGMEHLLAEEYEDAEYFFKNCLLNNFEDYPALYNLLYCYEQLNKDEEAIASLNQVLEVDPYCEVAWLQLGKLFVKMGQTKEALSAFEFAIISDDTFTGAYIEKGKILERIGRINEAIENYEVALNTTEPSAFVFQSIGRCHEKLGNDRLAQKFYLKSVQAEPTNEKGWESLINHHVQNENYKKAQHYLDSALEVNSDSFLLWIQSTEIHKAQKQNEKALAGYEKILDMGYFEHNFLLDYIDLYLEMEQWQNAYQVAQTAFKGYPESNELKLRLGGCSLIAGKPEEAKFHLNPSQLQKQDIDLILQLFSKSDLSLFRPFMSE
jgi:tetratricopeptide (TPR) repeat protein